MSKASRLRFENLKARNSELLRIAEIIQPESGWINYVRKALNISLRQLGKRLHISAQSAAEIEKREKNKNITLKGLSKAADVMGMKMVVVFVPKTGNVESIVETQARNAAFKSVMKEIRESESTDEEFDFNDAVKEKSEEFIKNLTNIIWD